MRARGFRQNRQRLPAPGEDSELRIVIAPARAARTVRAPRAVGSLFIHAAKNPFWGPVAGLCLLPDVLFPDRLPAEDNAAYGRRNITIPVAT